MIDGSLRSPKQTRVSVCLVCVQSMSGLRPVCVHCQAANVCCALSIVFALRPRGVHTEHTHTHTHTHTRRSACTLCTLCVNAVFTLRQRCVHDAFTLIFQKVSDTKRWVHVVRGQSALLLKSFVCVVLYVLF